MDESSQRTSQTVGNILQVTKNVIQENENFYDYYINKDNSLYHRQLPNLIQKSNLQHALVLYHKENKKQSNFSLSLDKGRGHSLLDNIRNAQVRSKKLPPLCPFYNDKGELLPSVVRTCRIDKKPNFENDSSIKLNTIGGRKNKIILKKIIKKFNYENNKTNNDFEKIETDCFNFNQSEYDKLIYNEKDIFGKKNEYLNMIKEKIADFRENEIKGNVKEYSKEKNFEKSIKKKNILLTFDSIRVEIFSSDKGKDVNNNPIPVFEYYLPFYFLPLFYYKGEEKFKIFLSKIIEWDNINKKFILNENQEKIFQDILRNCVDFQAEINQKEKTENIKSFKSEDQIKQNKIKFNSSNLTRSTKIRKDSFAQKNSMNNATSTDQHGYTPTMSGQIPNTYITNVGEENNKYNVKDRREIFPPEKENNYINYNIFEFLWLTPNEVFNVAIKMPLICVHIPKNNIIVKKYIDFDLLFYLYQNDFKYWDFYITKYLTGFKNFRTLLEDINSINEIGNKKFYLTHPKIKTYSFNNIEIINIASIKHKDILDNLIDGLNTGTEDKKENKTKNDTNKENNNKNITDTKKEQKEGQIQIIKDEEKLQASTIIQKSFVAIIRFVDNKTLSAKEYKIFFNFAQFQKFQKLEKFIDKISFLIKFIDINYIHKSVNIDYKSLDNFNENDWIKDFERYNAHYISSINNKIQKDNQRVFAEFSGMTKNTSIQIEIYRPLALLRTLNENGNIKTEKNVLGNNSMEKAINVGKDDIKGMSLVFYENYGKDAENNNK